MKNTQRFSDRVEDYIKYRPSYPAAFIDYLMVNVGIDARSSIADIGAGTGILTELLLPRVARVLAIEPNREMRLAAERKLRHFSNFHSIDGTAEATTLADRSVEAIVVAQAFHWFDRDRTRPEFQRIIKDNGRIVLVWNNRQNQTEFLQAYERGLQLYATDYNEVNHQNLTDRDLDRFFTNGFQTATFPNQQHFDLDGVIGRLNSCSYAPKLGTEEYIKLQSLIQTAFDRYAKNGMVTFEYETVVYTNNL
jgi:SAM-dependent methyltransferase